MEKEIRNFLREFEAKEKVKILFACETGSRAWGFPSADSDFDIRFLYVHSKEWYLSLGERKDTIESLDGLMDLSGWDLRKALLLLKRSNVPLIERFTSPIVYLDHENFGAEFLGLAENYYSPTAVFYHHFNLAAKCWEDVREKEKVKLKRFFYLLRSVLSCRWTIGKEGLVPMSLNPLLFDIPGDIKDHIDQLLKIKEMESESFQHSIDPSLMTWVENRWSQFEKERESLAVSSESLQKANEFFLKIIDKNG